VKLIDKIFFVGAATHFVLWWVFQKELNGTEKRGGHAPREEGAPHGGGRVKTEVTNPLV